MSLQQEETYFAQSSCKDIDSIMYHPPRMNFLDLLGRILWFAKKCHCHCMNLNGHQISIASFMISLFSLLSQPLNLNIEAFRQDDGVNGFEKGKTWIAEHVNHVCFHLWTSFPFITCTNYVLMFSLLLVLTQYKQLPILPVSSTPFEPTTICCCIHSLSGHFSYKQQSAHIGKMPNLLGAT